MPNLLKATVLSAGLLAATALAAQAQSLSSVAPNGPVKTAAPAQPYVSPPRIGLDPGASVSIKDAPSQPSVNTASTLIDHPYSGSVDKTASGPKPN